MPRGDGTGPMGKGSMTGRGAGYCSDFSESCLGNAFSGFQAYGCGRGSRRQFCATRTPGFLRANYPQKNMVIDEKSFLSNQETILENQLKQVKAGLSKFKKDTE